MKENVGNMILDYGLKFILYDKLQNLLFKIFEILRKSENLEKDLIRLVYESFLRCRVGKLNFKFWGYVWWSQVVTSRRSRCQTITQWENFFNLQNFIDFSSIFNGILVGIFPQVVNHLGYLFLRYLFISCSHKNTINAKIFHFKSLKIEPFHSYQISLLLVLIFVTQKIF